MSSYDRLINACLLAGFHGTAVPPWVALSEGLAGVILFPHNLGPVGRLAAEVRAACPDALIAIDEEGGDVTRLHYETGSPYPGNLALGSVGDLDLTSRVAAAIAADLVAAGVNYNLAPSFDVNSDPDNPVIGVRSFGSSPGLVGAHGAAFVRAMRDAGIATAAKHFPGHGATVTDPHHALPVISCDLETLYQREIAPFVAAIEAGVSSLMVAHAVYPALDPSNPATLSRRILHDLVRGELGYEGVLLSTAPALVPAAEVADAAVRALQAGADLLLIGPGDGDGPCAAIRSAVTDAVRRGDLSVSTLERAASRVTTMRTSLLPGRSPGLSSGSSPGLDAARRAVRVEGDVVLREPAVVIELRAPANVVAGEAYWSVIDALNQHDLVALAARVDEQGPDAFLAAEDGRRVVIVVRDAYRIPWQRAWVSKLMAERPDTVLVAVGMPDDAALAPHAHVLTLGAGQPNIQAAIEALTGRLP